MSDSRVIGKGIWNPSAPTVDEMQANPTQDYAEHILRFADANDEQRAQAWQAFHESVSPEQLVERLKPLPISDDTKRSLWEAKKVTAPVPDAVNRVISALNQMAKTDPAALATAEKHPLILKKLIGEG